MNSCWTKDHDEQQFQEKFIELRKREVDMDEFLNKFETRKEKEMGTLGTVECEIKSLMDKLTRNANILLTLPQ